MVNQKLCQRKNFLIMNIKYLKIAREEFHDAIKYYETQQNGLGEKFQSDIRSTILRIKEFPNVILMLKKMLKDV